MEEFWWYVISGSLGFLLLLSLFYILYMKCAACCCSGILGCCCRCCCSSHNNEDESDSIDNESQSDDDVKDVHTHKNKASNVNYGTLAKNLIAAGLKAGFSIKKISIKGPGIDLPLTEKPFKSGTDVIAKLTPIARKGIKMIQKQEMSIDEFKLIVTWNDKNNSTIPLNIFQQ